MKRTLKRILNRLFRNPQGEARTFWKLLCGASVYAAVFCAVLYGLGAIFGALFDAWGLTQDNLLRAPIWAQQIVFWHTNFCYALAYIASGMVGLLLARRWNPSHHSFHRRLCLGAAGFGLAMGAGLTCAALLLDSMRLEAPLSEPSLSPLLIGAAAVAVLGKASSEVLTRRLIFDAVRRRGLAYAVSSLAAALLTARWTNPVSIVNALLMGLAGCALYERGGWISSAALTSAWTLWTSLIFGFPSVASSFGSVYALYHVSEAWMTGGNLGPDCGLWMTFALLIFLALLFRKELRRLAKAKIFHGNPNQNRTAATASSGRSRRGNRA